MRTVVIWDNCGQEPLQFFVVEGDWSKYDRLYINTYTEKTAEGKKLDRLLKELSGFMYGFEGNMLQSLSKEFPIDEVKAGARVVVCGFLP